MRCRKVTATGFGFLRDGRMKHIFKNIFPKKGKGEGNLRDDEKSLVKGLLNMGYRKQDIQYIINIGRKDTINGGRIQDDIKNNNDIKTKSDQEIKNFLYIQESYDPITGLNPLKNSDQRLIKARESMLSAVQLYNNPLLKFKTENFCVLAVIAWTYLVHEKLERIKQGSIKNENGQNYSLGNILGKDFCPTLDKAVIENLSDIIRIRNEIEHEIHYVLSEFNWISLLQACCINFEHYLTNWFGEELSLTHHISLALQFSKFGKEPIIILENSNLPVELQSIIERINQSINQDAYALKTYFTTEILSKPRHAEIHKLVSYDEAGANDQVAVKKIIEKVPVDNNYEKYPLRFNEIEKKIKKENKNINKNHILRIIKNYKLKFNLDFSLFHFNNPQHEKQYKEKGKLPKKSNVSSTYSIRIIDEIIRIFNEENSNILPQEKTEN